MWHLKVASIALIFLVTLIAGFYPFFKKLQSKQGHTFPIAESIAAGVFLGAGLMHMLGDASQGFYALHFSYPYAFLLAGAMFLLLLLLEHVGREIYHKQGEASSWFAILAVIMLSVHSFLAGAALGLSENLSVFLVILLAILAHKWAASLALAVRINQSSLSFKTGAVLFVIFALMLPLGAFTGAAVTGPLNNNPLLEPVFGSLAAGTFLYLGTLHGLERAVLVKQCCDLNRFVFVIIGFAIMAIVAIWT